MAANDDVVAAGAVDLELEAMKKDDCSWQPCEVYFSPTVGVLLVNYENDDSEDSEETLTSEKEALTRIRARSLPLQDDDCSQIKPGETVLANRDPDSEGPFFDAEVEKVVKVRHSKGTNCKCSFVIRWLNQDINGGSLKVPSSSVMRLANKSITNHPMISAFLKAVQLSNKNSSDSDMSPQMDIVSDFDLDLHDLLEKQIEGIRNSVHGSKKRIRDEFLVFEDVSKPNGKVQEVEVSSDKVISKRSTRSQKKGGPKSQTSPVIPPPIEDENSDKKSPLNPLAARAALASLMSHKSLEVSIETKTFKSLESESSLNPEKIVKKLFSTTSSDMLEEEEEEDDDEMGISETAMRATRGNVQKVKVKVNGVFLDNKVSNNKRRTRGSYGKQEETETIEITTEEDSSDGDGNGSHVRKDKNTLLATSLPERKTVVGTKNSSNVKRNTSGKTQDSEGNVVSNGGRAKKGLVDLKAQKVRSSPRLKPNKT